MPSIAIDAGPLIALFNRGDKHHTRALDFFAATKDKLVTNMAVVTETVHLLDFSRGAVGDFLSWIGASIEFDMNTHTDLPRIAAILDKYVDLPADFADASLVAMGERLGIENVATLDRDFDVYRLANGRALGNLLLGP